MGFLSFLSGLLRPAAAQPLSPAKELPTIPVAAVGDVAPARPKGADERFAACVAVTLGYEGGYSDDVHDPGGATNRGITIATLSEWLKRPATKAEVRDLSEDTARAIYRAKYWDAVKGDELPPGVDLAVFDYAVNSGVSRAVRCLQRCVGVSPDGVLGPVSLLALRTAEPAALAERICAQRLAFLRGLGQWDRYGRGWGRRVEDVRARAARMAG